MNETAGPDLLEILIFELGGQRYGLPVSAIREIVGAVLPMPLPGAPAVVEGVINLRGSVVPVLDLRQWFHQPAKPLEPSDHFVIARVADRLMALRVDHATDLARLAPADVEDLQGIGSSGQYVDRVAKLPDDLVLIQDLGALLLQAESAEIEQLLPNSPAPVSGGGEP
jgi:purine-binding chemotaxis protein CheW